MSLIFIDCEAFGPCPSKGRLTEFGMVAYPSKETFYGRILVTVPDPTCPARPIPIEMSDDEYYGDKAYPVFQDADEWLHVHSADSRPIMVSDNPAYDFQWINDGFHVTLGYNPLGYSARRIGDYYAGLSGSFYTKQNGWHKLRVTKHDHNPVNDAMGNLEAFEALELKLSRFNSSG